MLPIDPNVLDERTSVIHTSVRDNVAERDGRRCILTGASNECEAAHIIPLMKGNEYNKALTECMCSVQAPEDVIDDINDVRNGIFIKGDLHTAFGVLLAVLVTPNFAMDVSDVPGSAHTPTHTSTGCTLHIFEGDIIIGASLQWVLIESGSQVRIADKAWPPAVLFDAVYASLALKTFSVKTSIDIYLKGNEVLLGTGLGVTMV
ncbi:hypothetical protein DAEQUDRAFT_770878 [Daedalea quercina L-15889]|uniref:HNH nuclease domain-containing protein n=1 Tax=Daedalea quercina L-15889 TaxID=1314783 RepID=A0A165KHE4_9APHY|nr:hypothetical protein DAEQUDRAFT_770878 [Daedalea quercina L-15889]